MRAEKPQRSTQEVSSEIGQSQASRLRRSDALFAKWATMHKRAQIPKCMPGACSGIQSSCDSRELQFLELRTLDNEQTQLDSQAGGLESPSPGSVKEAMLEAACRIH